jgi:hypothetical protein
VGAVDIHKAELGGDLTQKAMWHPHPVITRFMCSPESSQFVWLHVKTSKYLSGLCQNHCRSSKSLGSSNSRNIHGQLEFCKVLGGSKLREKKIEKSFLFSQVNSEHSYIKNLRTFWIIRAVKGWYSGQRSRWVKKYMGFLGEEQNQN